MRFRTSATALMASSALLLISIGAASAKPPCPPKCDDPPPPPVTERYDVTMTFSNAASGLATTPSCTGAQSLVMELNDRGALVNTDLPGEAPMLDVHMPTIDWYRWYPYYPTPESALAESFNPGDYPSLLGGFGITGCHGAGIDVYVDGDSFTLQPYHGALSIVPGDGTIEFLWQTDNYTEYVNVGKKKPRWIGERENVKYQGTLSWDSAWDPQGISSGTVTGPLDVSHYLPNEYTPYAGSPVQVEFTLTIHAAAD